MDKLPELAPLLLSLLLALFSLTLSVGPVPFTNKQQKHF